MEVALKDGLEKFPNSVLLKEWLEKMNELFRGNHEGTNNTKVNDSEGYNEVNRNDMVDGNGDDTSPVRGLVISEVNIEKDVSYNTPVNTNDLTMSQFHRLPGVNDEMIHMLEETELQVYRRKKLMSGLRGEDMVGINLGEQVENAAEDADIEIEEILKELKTEDLKCRLFATLLQIYIKKFDVKPSFRDVALVVLMHCMLS
ncbi:unnamed protein product [Lactuca virosa]|uniref:Uncharacterized protein n=1 Tax=Lactuca virosa TaxID=75947 RepID=A0AAU9PL62_9ASTR|nr:unnamed protein product [Lactuca virosa]